MYNSKNSYTWRCAVVDEMWLVCLSWTANRLHYTPCTARPMICFLICTKFYRLFSASVKGKQYSPSVFTAFVKSTVAPGGREQSAEDNMQAWRTEGQIVSLVTRVWIIITKETASRYGKRLRTRSEQTTGGGSPVWGLCGLLTMSHRKNM
jgi:hypothetical protein